MTASLAGKRVLVLSDDEGLSRAIALYLQRAQIAVNRFIPGRQQGLVEAGDFDLIVVALSSPDSEPLVTLADASLTGQVGTVPLLIISARSLQADPEDRIARMEFPFELDELGDKVRQIFQEK